MEKDSLRARIIEDLLEEEEAENTLISIYLSLLDLGVENNILEEKKANFRKNMEVLYKESIWHKKVISTMCNKFLKAYEQERK